MSRPRKVDRTTQVKIWLPASLVGEINLLLFSEFEGRIPLGKLSSLFETAVRKHLKEIKDARHPA